MKLSILTAVHNSKDTIEDCLKSISSQTYQDIEHIIIDGGSIDGTVEIIQNEKLKIKNCMLVSETDRGIYDALNKGIKFASGDVIGLLHADDVYYDNNVLNKVAKKFEEKKVDSVYGDLVYVKKNNLNKVVRSWKAGEFNSLSITSGWMPPHPTFFVKKEIFNKYGMYDTSFKFAADYDLILRYFGRNKITSAYLPEVLIKMRWGGKSNKNLRNIFIKSLEDLKALRKNNIPKSFFVLIKKNLSKIPQFFSKSNFLYIL